MNLLTGRSDERKTLWIITLKGRDEIRQTMRQTARLGDLFVVGIVVRLDDYGFDGFKLGFVPW